MNIPDFDYYAAETLQQANERATTPGWVNF